jgi:dTDP-4-dehydrorhamnose 3,5-epimerase-like enzyme
VIKLIDRYFTHKDQRGSLEGLINFGRWAEFNLIRTQADVVRGNHYHEDTTELFIILRGQILVQTQKVRNNRLTGPVHEHIVQKGHVFLVEPFVNHTFRVKKPSKWINVLSRKIKKAAPDIHTCQG